MGEYDFSAWYQRNRERLNLGRRIRYRIERDYKDRVLETNRKSRQNARDLQLVDRRRQGVLKSTSVEVPPFKTFIFDGVEFMTIKFLADFLGRCVQTVRAWERSGVIPAASKTSPRGDRLYSQSEAEAIREKLTSLGLLTKRREPPQHRVAFLVRYKATDRRLVMELRSVAVLAKACGRTVVAITNLEKKNAIPETPLRQGKGHKRLYTDSMIDAVREAFLAAGGEIRAQAAQDEFTASIINAWTGLGVFDMEIIY